MKIKNRRRIFRLIINASKKIKDMNNFSDYLTQFQVPDVNSLSMPAINSGYSVHTLTEAMLKIQKVAAEHKNIQRKGAEAQIESVSLLEEQRAELEVMREAINALLMHNLEQSKQHTIEKQARDEIEADRFRLNTNISKIAAWAGVISAILGALAICIQLVSSN